MKNPKIFTNDTFEVLECLYRQMDEYGISRTTQQEIAERLNKSRATVNSIFSTLKSEGYLTKVDKKECCYLLTDDAKKIAKFIIKEHKGASL